MLRSKSYLLLVLLFVFVIGSLCTEEKARRTESNDDTKKNVFDRYRDGYRRREKVDLIDDEDPDNVDERLAAIASLGDPRHLQYLTQGNNYRTRARWPAQSASPFYSSFDNFASENDRSRMDLSSLFSSMSQENTPILNSAASCHSLVDQQYPIFSDVCGAVPQARYSLPNTFGHRERWQAAQALDAFVSTALDPSCIRSLRLLMCPVLFPPCPSRHEPPAILPCQSFCRAVKARCGTPALDSIICETLPLSSDLCPIGQSYGSFAPPSPSSLLNQPSQMTDGFSSPNFPMSRSYSPLRSLLAAQGFQSPLSSASQQATGSMNFNTGVAPTMDSFTPLLADFSSRSFSNDPRQASRYSPLARSMIDARPQADAQFSSASRPAAISSIVKA